VNTITAEFLPQQGTRPTAHPPLRAPHAALRRVPARWSWMPTKPAGWGVLIAFTAFAAAVVATAWLAVQEIADRGLSPMAPVGVDPSAARSSVAPTPAEAPPRADAAQSPEGSPGGQAPSTTETAETPHAEIPPPVVEPPQAAPIQEKPAPRRAATENRKRSATRANSASEAGAAEGRAATVMPQPTEVAPSPAPVAVPQPPVPDRWETMNAALAACSREGLLAGMMCTERVRYQYCEGYWGQVPQCRAASRPGSSR
jgi:hypothetical protein